MISQKPQFKNHLSIFTKTLDLKIILTLFLVIISLNTFAQKETNIWYFGNYAGLDFNSGVPVVLTNSAMSQAEGVSSISDANGSLLFYTDGISVWNANHVVMPNGFGLKGSQSTTQSALIVKQPGSATLYYIFTQDAQLAPNGFNYSILDISLNGGLGDITIKNTLIYTPSSEKLTAINQSNGFDVWIITHDYNNNVFQSYSLTAAGFNSTPVVSSVGPVFTGNDVIGYLKVSSDGTHLAMALSQVNEIWLLDFDATTGLVTNPIFLNTAGGANNGAYGVEFSPNCNILYGSVEGSTPVHLYQWDISSGNAVTINASRIDLNPTLINAAYLGSLSIAPDGKIYFTRNTCDYLGCISNPDVLGLGCNMIDSAIYLAGNTCVYGLPNLNQSLYNTRFTFTGLCFGDSTFFEIPNTTGLFGAQWDFNDPTSGPNNISYLTNPAHIFTAPGTYYVQVLKYYAATTDTAIVPVVINALPTVNLGADTSFCVGTPFIINAGTGYTSYLWHDNSADSTFTTTQPGTFWVSVSSNGCSGTDTVVLSAATCSVPGVNLSSSDTIFCGKQCLDFTDLSTNNPTSWQWYFPGADSVSSTQQNPTGICYNSYGSFDVTLIACNAAGCDTLFLPLFIVEYQLPPTPVITQSNDTLYCTPAYSYAWYNTNNPSVILSTSSFYVTSNGGSFFVFVSDSVGCKNSSAIFAATGTGELNNSEPFMIFPNPVNDVLHLYVNSTLILYETKLTIYNVMGQELFKKTLHLKDDTIDLRNLANGVYFIQLKSGNNMLNTKIVVSH